MSIIVDEHTKATNRNLGEAHTNAAQNAKRRITAMQVTLTAGSTKRDAFLMWRKAITDLLTEVPLLPRQPVPAALAQTRSEGEQLAKHVDKTGDLREKIMDSKGLAKKYYTHQHNKVKSSMATSVYDQTTRITAAEFRAIVQYQDSNLSLISQLPSYTSFERANRMIDRRLDGLDKTRFSSDITAINKFLADLIRTY